MVNEENSKCNLMITQVSVRLAIADSREPYGWKDGAGYRQCRGTG